MADLHQPLASTVDAVPSVRWPDEEQRMHQYQDALHHLNLALDAVIAQGDTAAIASIAAPIALIERVIINRRIEMIATACPPPTMLTAVE